MVSFRQLRYLEALARTRHFGQAARDCAVSQPALSMQIKDLEDELNLKLVERRKSGVGLTDKGEAVAARARNILASVRDLVDYAKGQEGMLTGVLNLGAIPSIAPYLLPAALPALQARFPDLSLRLRETVTESLVRELVSGSLDAILVALPIDDPAVETLFLFDDAFLLATKAMPDNAGLGPATPDMLAEDRLLLLEEGHCLRDQALSYCHLMAPDVRQSFGASSLTTIMQMVANGYGVTLLPEMATSIEVHPRDDIRLLRFAEPEPKREIGLVWRKSSPRTAEFEELGALLRKAAPARLDSAQSKQEQAEPPRRQGGPKR